MGHHNPFNLNYITYEHIWKTNDHFQRTQQMITSREHQLEQELQHWRRQLRMVPDIHLKIIVIT